MKISILSTLLVPSISAAVLPARHTLNEVCFRISARSSPWDAEAEEIPLGPEFDEDFCLDNRFKTLRDSNGHECSMDTPDFRFACHHKNNGTTKFDITYPAADGPPYLTYNSAPGMFYACPADSDPEYTFDLFSAKVSFGSVCVPVTLTLEPAEKSCPSDNNSSAGTTSSSIMNDSMTSRSVKPTTTDAGTDDDDSTQTLSTESATGDARPTTTSQSRSRSSITRTPSSAPSVVTDLDDNTTTTTRRNGTLITSSFGRPIPLPTISISDKSTSSTPEGRGTNLTALETGSASASGSMTTMPPVLFVPATTTGTADATDESPSTESSSTPVRVCSVPSSAPSIAPWRVGSSANTAAFNNFDGTGEAALSDKNSTVFEFVIPADFGMSTSELMGLEGTEDIDESAGTTPSISGNGLCALQFRLPFCNNLPNGYPCYSFSGTTQEVKDNAGVMFSLLHNGGTVEWDDEAMHQLFPGKNTILGTFECKEIGGGEVGDRTMSWLGSSLRGLGLDFLQAGGAESEFEDGVGAWVVACQD